MHSSQPGNPLRLFAVVALLGLCFFTAPTSAQGPQASVTGTVTDETGAVIPAVSIVAENIATTAETRTQSNDEGFYQLPFLPPGTYRIVAERAGYARVEVRDVVLAVNQAAELNIQMKVGGVTEQVTVEARGLILDTERATLGTVIDNARVSNLPLLGRNPYSLVALVPGARPSAGLNNLPVDQISTASASINGSRGNQNEYLLDGAPNSVAAQNQPAVYPSADAVQEFKVETNSYSAEYGRSAGGVFNVVTKSGTNEFHGNFFEFLRNDVFDANNFFANRAGQKKPPFRFNQYGATVGGPLNFPNFGEGGPVFHSGRNRTFFFAAFEGVRLRQGVTFVGTVPTLLQRQGDFSQTFNNQGQLIRIFDPVAGATNQSRVQFANNRIPLARIDPVALRALQFIPLPNTAGDPVTGLNNYISTASQRIDKDTFNVRVDHTLSDRQKIFGRFSFDDTPWVRPDVYGSIGSPSFGSQTFKRRNFAVDDVYTLNPTTVLNGRYSWSRLSNFRQPRSLGYDISQLGFPSNLGSQIGLATLPAVSVTGMSGSYSQPNIGVGTLFGVTDLIRFGMDTHSLQGSLTKTLGRHTLKIGTDFRLYRLNAVQQPDTGNNFSFAPNATQGPDPARASNAAGFGFASFLLGTGSGQITIVPALALQQKYLAFFVQDDYKPTQRLTLNLGLRYDYESPRTDRFNQLTNFDFDASPPLAVPGLNLRGALAFTGVGGLPREQWDADRNNIAPRVGMAYSLTDSTVVRAGFGIFYAATTGVGASAGDFGTSGFQAVTTFVGFQGNTPINFLSNPYPNGIIQPSGSSLGAATLLGQAVQFTERERATPYAEQWNLNVQQRLVGDVLFEVGYAGSRGLHLPGSLLLNQLPEETLRLGRALNDQVANPFFGLIRTGILSGPTVARGQLLRPYPHFDQITSVNSHYGSSTYHALLAKLDKRLSRGFNFTAAYSFSKLIDDVGSGPFGGEALAGAGIQNFYNLRAERSLSTLDAPHRLVLSYIYELPFGANQRFLREGVLSRVLGGWQLNGITTFQSGVPLSISATNTTGSLGGGQRPNLLRDPALPADERTAQRWFDTTAFQQPEPFTFGNAPRVIPGLRADGDNVTDFSLSKRTALGERVSLEFRAEFFNVFNTTKFSPPNTTLGSAAFGTISAQANLPRVTQFGLKLAY